MKVVCVIVAIVFAFTFGVWSQEPHQLGSDLWMESVHCKIVTTNDPPKGYKVTNCKLNSGHTLDDVVDEWYTLYIGNVQNSDGADSDDN